MQKVIDEFFKNEKIEYYTAVDYRYARVLREDIIKKEGFIPKSIIIFLIPYYSGEAKNLSVYAMAKDYHLYIKKLESRFAEHLEKNHKKCHCRCYSDHSPIDERHLASAAGLGVLGKNRLLINERYGSYVFIGEIISDIPTAELNLSEIKEVSYCEECRACVCACPTKSLSEEKECLSWITQKKGELTKAEAELICRVGTAWGCDVCQKACPHNKRPEKTPIPFFLENTVDELSYKLVSGMSREEFSERAFSWRGKKTVLRNLEILENYLK